METVVAALSPEHLLFLLGGLKVTLQVASISVVLSLAFGVVLGVVRYSSIRFISVLVGFWIDTIRNLPLLLIIFFAYFALPAVGLRLSPMAAAIVSLTIFTSALMAEIVRAGIGSIDRGQWEAAYATGLGYIGTLRHIVLPQALRNMTPAIVGQLVSLNKDTSLAVIITLQELLRRGQIVYAQNADFVIPVLIFISMCYFVINYSLSRFARYLERRYSF